MTNWMGHQDQNWEEAGPQPGNHGRRTLRTLRILPGLPGPHTQLIFAPGEALWPEICVKECGEHVRQNYNIKTPLLIMCLDCVGAKKPVLWKSDV